MTDSLLLLAMADTWLTRLGVLAVTLVIGVLLILTGLVNIQTQTAEESGRRRLVNKALGRSNTYEGSKAVVMGWVRLVCGICVMLFGIVFLFTGPFLAKSGSRRPPPRPEQPGENWNALDAFRQIDPVATFPELDRKVSVAFPEFRHDPERGRATPLCGGENGVEAMDNGPKGGVLVGAILFKGKSFGGALKAIQPIYQVADRYELGKLLGKPGGQPVLQLAKPGYAVGGVKIRNGLVLDALQFVFMKLNRTELDQKELYSSDWVGSQGGGPNQLSTEGRIASGLFVRHGEDLHGIGLNLLEGPQK